MGPSSTVRTRGISWPRQVGQAEVCAQVGQQLSVDVAQQHGVEGGEQREEGAHRRVARAQGGVDGRDVVAQRPVAEGEVREGTTWQSGDGARDAWVNEDRAGRRTGRAKAANTRPWAQSTMPSLS